MEYAKDIDCDYCTPIDDDQCRSKGKICDDNYMRYVGWEHTADDNCQDYKEFFNKNTVDIISNKVQELTEGVVSPDGKTIRVPKKTICSVMSQIYDQSRTPPTGDIYSRYIIPQGNGADCFNQRLINQTIELIVSYVKTEVGMWVNNSKLSAWVQVLGDFNEHGLQSHSDLQGDIRKRRPATMQFNMNY